MRPPLDGAVLVTGASSGIGREFARQLAPVARKLILVARRAERLQALSAELARPGLEIVVHPCDLTDAAALDRLVETIGDVDVLINNAGIGDVGLFERLPLARIEFLLRINVLSTTRLIHRLLPGMLKRGRGGILNVSSGWGLTFIPGMGLYCGAKHFVSGFTECLRLELRGTGVVVTQVCPGPVATEFVEVAGNPTGHDLPGILVISPERCARAALRGFARDRAMVIPGIMAKFLIHLGRVSPRWLLRLVYCWIGGWLRKRQTASSPSPAPGAGKP